MRAEFDGQDEDNSPGIHVWTDVHCPGLRENPHDDHRHPAGEVSAHNQRHFDGHLGFYVALGGFPDTSSSELD